MHNFLSITPTGGVIDSKMKSDFLNELSSHVVNATRRTKTIENLENIKRSRLGSSDNAGASGVCLGTFDLRF
jgi:hypothetical protein